MRNLAAPQRPPAHTGSADAASRSPAGRVQSPRPSKVSLQLATSLPVAGDAAGGADAGFASGGSAVRAAGVRAIAEEGMAGSAGDLPYLSVLQPAFGAHDLRGVKAYVGGPAARAASRIGARAYTVGDRIAFRERPDLRTAAHETAHVVQQRGGDGQPGGEPAGRHEQHADAVASAVVERRPAGPVLAAAGRGPGAGAVQAKSDGEADVDAIEKAGARANAAAAKHEENDTQMMLDGSSIFYRMMRTFFPEVLAKWNFAGVSYRKDYAGITMQRRGHDVDVTVGRDFVIGAKQHGLASRVLALQSALPMLDDGSGKNWAVVAASASTGGPPTRAEALKEAGSILQNKAGFGVASGLRAGPDEGDGFDARFWSEAGRVIVATVEPWFAMSQMVAHLGDEVPKAGGGTTRWHFDCYEGAQVERLYADWRTLSREEFNRKNSPLEIGFFSTRPDYYEKPVLVDKPGGTPFTRSDEPQEVKGRPGTFDYVKTPIGKPMAQVLEEAPPGAWVIWTNRDVTARLRAFSARKAAGQALSDKEQELNDRLSPWENENSLKVGRDQYAAFPFGVVDEKTIVEGMAEIVFRPDPVPAGYIEKNIFISAVRIPKDASTTTT